MTIGVQQVIVMGDLNETLTAGDRHPRPAPISAARAAASPIRQLIDAGYMDVYRAMHPHIVHLHTRV